MHQLAKSEVPRNEMAEASCKLDLGSRERRAFESFERDRLDLLHLAQRELSVNASKTVEPLETYMICQAAQGRKGLRRDVDEDLRLKELENVLSNPT